MEHILWTINNWQLTMAASKDCKLWIADWGWKNCLGFGVYYFQLSFGWLSSSWFLWESRWSIALPIEASTEGSSGFLPWAIMGNPLIRSISKSYGVRLGWRSLPQASVCSVATLLLILLPSRRRDSRMSFWFCSLSRFGRTFWFGRMPGSRFCRIRAWLIFHSCV